MFPTAVQLLRSAGRRWQPSPPPRMLLASLVGAGGRETRRSSFFPGHQPQVSEPGLPGRERLQSREQEPLSSCSGLQKGKLPGRFWPGQGARLGLRLLGASGMVGTNRASCIGLWTWLNPRSLFCPTAGEVWLELQPREQTCRRVGGEAEQGVQLQAVLREWLRIGVLSRRVPDGFLIYSSLGMSLALDFSAVLKTGNVASPRGLRVCLDCNENTLSRCSRCLKLLVPLNIASGIESRALLINLYIQLGKD
uniref:Uncharacterized protein n=1 Tax=Sphaerodactylus townsendi TaxID=933632 RepID=A0ACB8E7Z8_9SAUR